MLTEVFKGQHIRGPLAAGYLTLGGLWIMFGASIPRRSDLEPDSPAELVAQVFGVMGASVIVPLTLLAWFVGGVVERVVLRQSVGYLSDRTATSVKRRAVERDQFIDVRTLEAQRAMITDAIQRLNPDAREHLSVLRRTISDKDFRLLVASASVFPAFAAVIRGGSPYWWAFLVPFAFWVDTIHIARKESYSLMFRTNDVIRVGYAAWTREEASKQALRLRDSPDYGVAALLHHRRVQMSGVVTQLLSDIDHELKTVTDQARTMSSGRIDELETLLVQVSRIVSDSAFCPEDADENVLETMAHCLRQWLRCAEPPLKSDFDSPHGLIGAIDNEVALTQRSEE